MNKETTSDMKKEYRKVTTSFCLPDFQKFSEGTAVKSISDDLKQLDRLFRCLLEKVNRLESKKYLYRNIDDLTLIEINTIMVIGSCTRSMSEIASQLGVTNGTPTVTIDRLLAKGYIRRLRDEEDRRLVFINLTQKGIDVHRTLVSLKAWVGEKLFGILELEEISSMNVTLSKILLYMDELLGKDSSGYELL